MIKSFMNKKFILEEEIYVFEILVIIGDVILRKKLNVWFGVVIRGDEESIVIGERINI